MVLELPNYFSLHRLTLKKRVVLEEYQELSYGPVEDGVSFLEDNIFYTHVMDEEQDTLLSIVNDPHYHGQALYTCDDEEKIVTYPGIHPLMNLSFYHEVYRETYRPVQFVTSLLSFVREKEQAGLLIPDMMTLGEKRNLFDVFDSYAIDNNVFFRIPKDCEKGDMILRSLLQTNTSFDVKYCKKQLTDGVKTTKTLCKMYENPLLSKPNLVLQLEAEANQ